MGIVNKQELPVSPCMRCFMAIRITLL